MDDLAARFGRLIDAFGPISVARFMGESNAHYYASRDPLGAAGDFTTAPEISQMFGELVGLWMSDLWQRAGQPANAVYAELGPGRGTLASDALRAMKGVGWRPEVHLVEGSPALRRMQEAAVPGGFFHDDVATLPAEGPLLIVANEFLDALPIRQLVRAEAGWRERMVARNDPGFAFVAGPQPMDQAVPDAFGDAAPGTIIETNPGAAAVMEDVARRVAGQGGAAVFFDYGYLSPQTGSTLQAVREHRKVDPLSHPGEADLTAHADFAMLADIARDAGCRVQTATQGDWLRAMGIDLRADTLARATPKRSAEIAIARDRLVEGESMGELFKVLAVTAPHWPQASGFAG